MPEVMTKNDSRWIEEAHAIAARHARRSGLEPEDLAQQALVRALQQPPMGPAPGPWLERITRNLSTDLWRRANRGRRALAGCAAEPKPLHPHTPKDLAVARQSRRAVRHALRRIPAALRQPLVLRFMLGFSYARITARLGVPAATARTRVHRSLVRLRTLLAAQLRAFFLPLGGVAQPVVLAFVLAAEPLATPGAVLGAAPPRPPAPADTMSSPRHQGARPDPPAAATPSRPRPAAAPQIRAATEEEPSLSVSPTGVRRFQFEDDDIEGGLTGPEGEHLRALSVAPHPSLIEIRGDFVPEMLKSLEDQ